MKELEAEGFVIIPNLISNNKIRKCLDLIKDGIHKAADEIDATIEEYLKCTGRWGTNSSVTVGTSDILQDEIQTNLERKLGLKIIFKKSNIICKTSELTDAIPFHQDISYSPNDPYHFSLWLSLNDIDKNSAPLRIVRNSHKNKIDSAIDFWSPHFRDKYDIENKDIISITVNAGDAIIFDSKLWHGSDENYSHKDRFAYVTRWLIEGRNFSKIPEIKETDFGMFNCGKLTNQILEKSLELFNYNLQDKVFNKEELIMVWIDILTQNTNFLQVNNSEAIKDLKKLNILNKACDLHDAGNISGLVYKNLWFSLLSSLNSQIRLVGNKEYEI